VKQTCILGGGICGLASAWKREQEGNEVTIIESSSRVGGIIQSERLDGFLLDYGPNTLSLRLRKTADLLEETGILEHAIDANQEANKRFIVRKGKLVALPNSFASFVSSSFLSPLGKLRLLLEPFLPRGKNRENESVASFVSRRLGREALEYGANPLLAGIYAAKPETLCMRHAFPAIHALEKKHRSLLLGKMFGFGKSSKLPESRLISFAQGMGELPDRMKAGMKGNFIFDHRVTKVAEENGKWRVFASDPTGTEWDDVFDEVICTLPAHQLGKVSWSNVAQVEKISTLQEASHFPLSVVYQGFEKKDVPHPLDGFGFLVPEIENMDILGSLFSSTLFPHRAPPGKVLISTFVGGERNPGLALEKEDVIFNKVSQNLSSLLGIREKPVFQQIMTWKKAIPLPDKGFGERKAASNDLSSPNRGLVFSGSHLTGPPLPNCLDPLE
jgi:protoporphyrinogen/coproporphyrinogen III oxidase